MKHIAGILIVVILLITFVLAIYRRKYLGRNCGVFIIALGVITIVHGYGTYCRAMYPEYNSYPLSLIGVALVLFFLFLLYFHLTLQTPKYRMISKCLIIFFLANFTLSVLLSKNFFIDPPLTVFFGGVFIVSTSIILVLAETFNSPEVFSIKNYFPFWACISVLITYLGAGPLVFARHNIQSLGADVYYLVLLLVNILGYSVLLIGIFNAKKQKNN